LDLIGNFRNQKTNCMKTNLYFSVMIFIFLGTLINGCKKLGIEEELRIDIGTYFQDDFVTIKMDDNVIFSDSISTNSVLGVSKILVFDYPIGKYEITVDVNGISKKEFFRHKKNRFIYISFKKENSDVSIIYPEEKYVYE